jgi:hypothetical protein
LAVNEGLDGRWWNEVLQNEQLGIELHSVVFIAAFGNRENGWTDIQNIGEQKAIDKRKMKLWHIILCCNPEADYFNGACCKRWETLTAAEPDKMKLMLARFCRTITAVHEVINGRIRTTHTYSHKLSFAKCRARSPPP